MLSVGPIPFAEKSNRSGKRFEMWNDQSVLYEFSNQKAMNTTIYFDQSVCDFYQLHYCQCRWNVNDAKIICNYWYSSSTSDNEAARCNFAFLVKSFLVGFHPPYWQRLQKTSHSHMSQSAANSTISPLWNTLNLQVSLPKPSKVLLCNVYATNGSHREKMNIAPSFEIFLRQQNIYLLKHYQNSLILFQLVKSEGTHPVNWLWSNDKISKRPLPTVIYEAGIVPLNWLWSKWSLQAHKCHSNIASVR
jgi:hypothetical protein